MLENKFTLDFFVATIGTPKKKNADQNLVSAGRNDLGEILVKPKQKKGKNYWK
jgi:hypothetical protein